jgi:hypothetical protein
MPPGTQQRSFATIVTGSLFAVLIATTSPGYSETHPVRRVPKALALEQGRLTVKTSSTSLRQVMEELSSLTGVEVSWLGKGMGRTVSVNLSDLPVEDAIRRILRKENYVLFYTSREGSDELSRVLILPRDTGTKQPPSAGRWQLAMETLLMDETPDDEKMAPEGTEQMEQVDEQAEQWAKPVAELLRNGRTTEATEELKYALARDRNPQVRLMALEGLSMLGPESAEEMIEAALNDPEPAIRAQALRCLELHKDKDPRIREFLYPDSP